MADLPRYRSHKVVGAAPIYVISIDPPFVKVKIRDDVAAQIEVPENFYARGRPTLGDYLVSYEDGYLSWSPKQAFEEGYSPEVRG